MKNKIVLLSAIVAYMLTACDNPMRFETKVHEDGSLDKTIILEKADSSRVENNIFGINQKKGWNVDIQKLPSDNSKEKSKSEFRIQFQKSFASAEAINNELDLANDSLFHVHAKFEKKFRWFYTYLSYTETIRPINRFTMVSTEDYFNEEDHSFVDRLPAEGKSISKADSLYLQMLNEKISDHFANMGIFKEQYKILEEAIKRSSLEKKWLDTLYKNQEFIYNHIDKMKGEHDFAAKIADSLKIPLPKPQSSKDFKELSKEFNTRLDFMAFTRDGKYVNIIEMPLAVTYSNADSVAGNKLYWRPLVTKFVFKDYTMYAEGRRLNLWAVAVSIVIFGITVFVFRRK